MAREVELFVAVFSLVMGLSHALQPQVWVDFFIRLRELGKPGVVAAGMFSLAFGAFVATFHNVWHGLPMVLTLVGWAAVLKGLLFLVAPDVGMRSLTRVSPERRHEFVVAGLVSLALSGMCWWLVLAR